MKQKENIVSKAKASISWIYSNLLGKKANFELLHPTELKRAEEEYVAWVSYLLPIEQAIKEFEELKAKQEKDTKLLELYRERKELQNYRGEHPEEYYEVDKQITEIEEELK